MKIKVSDYISEFLSAQGVSHVFEVAGGMIAHLLDSLHKNSTIDIVSVHHEQAAAFAVDAYGRVAEHLSVGLATSGPGAINLLTGIANCYFDSVPALFITGQVNTSEQKGQKDIRQLGFQEADIVSMAQPITKKCYQVMSKEDIEDVFYDAYKVAISGRPGPVLIDIPMDVQRGVIEVAKPVQVFPQSMSLTAMAEKNIQILLDALSAAQKPLLLVGGGVRAARCSQLLTDVTAALGVPVVTSLMGLDAIAYDDPLRVGFIGSYGNRWANTALGEADVLVVLGSRLDIRQTGADVDSFSKGKTIFHIDCEQGEINNRVKNCIPICTDLESFFKYLQVSINNKAIINCDVWKKYISDLKLKWPDTEEIVNKKSINPNVFFHQLSKVSGTALGYSVDVGAHQMWAAQSLEIGAQQFFITSAGLGAMGYSLPAAIGASLARNKQPVVVIVGDGSLQMNIQELQTIVRNDLPIKIVVINNQSLGMITQFQDAYFEGRYQSTYWGYSAPSFAKVAAAYGIRSAKVSSEDQVETLLEWLWQEPDKASLLEVLVPPHLHVYPKIAFGRPITEMEPFVKPIEMEST